jgi:glycosyltransferase involved in cell wall biosynthesis
MDHPPTGSDQPGQGCTPTVSPGNWASVKVSVVIPAYNEEKLLPATLDAIRGAMTAFAELGWATELIVCDNNSTDRTPAVATAGGATVVFEPVNQIGRARNTGAAAATGDWLIFVDADSRPTGTLFAAVAEAINSGRVIGGGSTVRVDGGGVVLWLLTRLWNASSRMLRYMAGSFIFVERSAFQELKGFSSEMFAAEEIDLSRRLKRLARRVGRRLVILDDAPLETSARKVELYSPGEWLSFVVRSVWRPRATVRDRAACGPWYDGRR